MKHVFSFLLLTAALFIVPARSFTYNEKGGESHGIQNSQTKEVLVYGGKGNGVTHADYGDKGNGITREDSGEKGNG